MQQAEQETDIASLFNRFRASRYPDKVHLYDRQFGLIPFAFPHFDIHLSWYMNAQLLKELIDILRTERRALHTLYIKTVGTADGSYRFDVVPVYIPERKFLNEFILQKFRKEKRAIQALAETTISSSSSPQHFLEEQIAIITRHLEWIPTALSCNVYSEQTKFLQIFYNGVVAVKSGQAATTNVRRKFVELYLYAQGQLMMEHLSFLTERYSTLAIRDSAGPLSLRLKLVMLHQLGIIEMLRQKLRLDNDASGLIILSNIIALLTAETTLNRPEVFRYLSLLGTSHAGDLLTLENINMVEARLLSIDYR